MSNGRPSQHDDRTVVLVAVLALPTTSSVSATTVGNADGPIEVPAQEAWREADGVTLQALADSRGALAAD